jgi:CheY-like chemotaxis protein
MNYRVSGRAGRPGRPCPARTATTPDLVLLDYAMPLMHGADVARARGQPSALPIVFVTGYAETDQLEAALGPDAPVLRKPSRSLSSPRSSSGICLAR